jgi:TPR repeat protein
MDGDLLAEARLALVVTGEPASSGPAAAIVPQAPAPPAEVAPPAPAARPKSAGGAPVLTPEDRERAEKLVARGERELSEGNIASARNFFLRAAEAGLARGALLLATTYDPRELSRMRAQGIQPNPAEARKWYERARDLGAPEASERLTRLGGS